MADQPRHTIHQLLDFTWLQARLEASDIHALLADVAALEPLSKPHTLVRDALRLSVPVLAEDKSQLAEQLHSRLVGVDDSAITALLAQAAAAKTIPWLRRLHPTIDQADGPLVHTFQVHPLPVSSVAILPDGQHVLSGSWDATMTLWNLRTTAHVRTFRGHKKDITALAVLPDGLHALSGSHDTTLRLWNLETGECLSTFRAHSSSVSSIMVLPDGQHALSASRDTTLKLWNITTNTCIRTFQGHSDGVGSLAIISNGQYALSGAENMKLWDLTTGECVHTFTDTEGHQYRAVVSINLFPDEQHILTAYRGSSLDNIKLWNLVTGECLRTFEPNRSVITHVAVLPDGQHALVILDDEDKTVNILDIATGTCLQTFAAHQRCWSSAMLPDNRHVLTGLWDGTLKLWDVRTPRKPSAPHADYICQVTVLPDEQHALSASRDKTVKLWDSATGTCLRTLQGHEYMVTSIVGLPDGQRALSGSLDQTVKLWCLATGECLHTFIGHRYSIGAITLLPNGTQFLSAGFSIPGDALELKVWDIATGACLHTFHKYGDKSGSMVISNMVVLPHTNHVLCGLGDALTLLDLTTGEHIHTLRHNDSFVTSVAVLSDGQFVLSTSEDQTLKLWQIATGALTHTLYGHTDWVTDGAVRVDGKVALSASKDCTLKVWELTTGVELATFYGERPFHCCAISADGRTAVAGDRAGIVHFLRIEGLD
jgi:WD40 repeat protein